MLGDKHLKKTRLGITDVNFKCLLTHDHNIVAVLQLLEITKSKDGGLRKAPRDTATRM